MKFRRIGNVFIIIGVVIFSYLIYEEIYSHILENKILAQTEEVAKDLQKEVNTSKGVSETTSDSQRESFLENLELSINKIDLKVRVLEGTSKDILRVAVGHLEGTGDLGDMNENFVILGHRSYVTGRFFNRLNEVSEGDTLKLSSKEQTFTYQVIDKKIIKPDQVEVLSPVEGKSVVTLITCHPMYSNKQRLVLVAEKVDQ